MPSGTVTRFLRWLHAQAKAGGPPVAETIYGSPYGGEPPQLYGVGPYGSALGD